MTRSRSKKEAWQADVESQLARQGERDERFTTVSDFPIERLYTWEDLEATDPAQTIGQPGDYPYTRGIHPTMYRGKRWTMRQFAGFGTAAESNQRYQYLLKNGQTGLSVAFHLPTLMGRDSDDPRSRGEVGKCGVAIDSLRDMETLFSGIPLGAVTTSMTTNAPAAIIWSMYLAVAEKQGVPWDKLGGTIQNDILKEYIAQKTYIFPPAPSMRLIADIFEFAHREVPTWNTISISGYHIREAGATAVQELAFTLADGLEYVKTGIARGLAVDDFVPRLSFFFNSHNDFFEEIAKFRAARRIWARKMREQFKAKDPRSWKLRFHTQTAGCSLTAQQPYNNIVRTTIQALAGVLGGTQSLHTNSLDETLALPSEQAATIALRTQQIIAYESGVANTVDPLGGSYFVESLTDRIEEAALDYIDRIDQMGGMIKAIELGFPQREIANASYRYQQQIDSEEKIIVGVNRFQVDEPQIPILQIGEEIERAQIEAVKKVRQERNGSAVGMALQQLKMAARGDQNMMPTILNAVRVYATLGEICDALRAEWGEYREVANF